MWGQLFRNQIARLVGAVSLAASVAGLVTFFSGKNWTDFVAPGPAPSHQRPKDPAPPDPGNGYIVDNPPVAPPETPPGDSANPKRPPEEPLAPEPATRSIADAISLESLSVADASNVPFPAAYFGTRIREELADTRTTLATIRVGVAFVEPREARPFSDGGTATGYLLVALPAVGECSRKFGGQSYRFDLATTSQMKAINDAAPAIAAWLKEASKGEVLRCPEG